MRHYGSTGSSIANMPSGWHYGGVLTIETAWGGYTSSLNLQLAWDVRHNTQDSGYLWMRTRDEISGYRGWSRLAFSSEIPTKVSQLTNDSGYLTSLPSHTHSYIPLSGGTLSSDAARISRAGSSVYWYQGRSNAMMYISSYSGYNAIASMKTTNGDWSLGVYANNYMYFTYVTDANYNSGTNTTTCQFVFRPDGYIEGNLSGYDTSAGNADSVDSHHFATVTSLPSSPNSSTVYFVTG